MLQTFVADINKVPTHIKCWGKTIEDDLSSCKCLILLIPGNPGSTEFYTEFLQTIYCELEKKVPVWTLSHAGHENLQINVQNIPALETNKDLYNLNGQVEHKIEFIKKYIPNNIKLYIIGHSIGAYTALELLKNDEIQKQIEKCYLLLPTIEYMAETESGKLLINFVKPIISLIVFFVWIFSILPNIIQIILIKIYLFVTRRSSIDAQSSIINLLQPNVIKSVFFMAFDEMESVKERNDAIIENNKNKLKFYYSKSDQWAPESYYKRLKNQYPDLDAICEDKHHHAFVLHSSREMGITVANWIKETTNAL